MTPDYKTGIFPTKLQEHILQDRCFTIGIEPIKFALKAKCQPMTSVIFAEPILKLVRGKGVEPLTERWQRSIFPLN